MDRGNGDGLRETESVPSRERPAGKGDTHRLLQVAEAAMYYGASAFNAMFAICATATLLGIIFITRPQETMHEIPPSWWIPLALLIIPAQIMSQAATWYTVWKRQTPTPLAISRNFPSLPFVFRPVFSLVWAANFLIGFAIVVSLYEPEPNHELGWWFLLLVTFITFCLTSLANIYLMLFTRSASMKDNLANAAWRYRHVVDLLIAVVAAAYYKAVQW